MHIHMNSKCLTLLQSITFDTHLFIIMYQSQKKVYRMYTEEVWCVTHVHRQLHIFCIICVVFISVHAFCVATMEIIICVEIITCVVTTHPSGCWTWPRKIHASTDAGKITVLRRLICMYFFHFSLSICVPYYAKPLVNSWYVDLHLI